MYLVINMWVIAVNVSNFYGQYLRNHWTLDIGILGYIGIVWPKEHSPEVWSVPPVTPCIMFFGQINTPATLPIYVLMHLVNRKFLGRLYCTLPAVAYFFYPIQWSLSFASEEHDTHQPKENNIVKPHSHRKAYCDMMYICVMACFILEFSCCISCSPPLIWNGLGQQKWRSRGIQQLHHIFGQ